MIFQIPKKHYERICNHPKEMMEYIKCRRFFEASNLDATFAAGEPLQIVLVETLYTDIELESEYLDILKGIK